ncbi:MAG: fibronectin type III domain-containing protein, partial [Clostridia bacterium]|nr:fibronectin type III domain-containing protein [Clostridia bacterium]
MKNKKFIPLLLAFSLILGMLPFGINGFQGTVNESNLKAEAAKGYGNDVIITPAQDEFSYFIIWKSDESGNERVQYTKSSNVINGVFPNDAVTVAAEKISAVRFSAKISGLEPDTDYSYRVGSNNAWSKVNTLKTHAKDNSFSFIFAADPQIGTYFDIDTRAWSNSLDKLYNWFEDDVEFLMSAGDQINVVEKESEYDVYKAPGAMRTLPQIVTVGNHDDGPNHSYNFVYENVDQNTLSDAGQYGGDFWVSYDGVLILDLNLNNLSVALHESFIKNAIAEYTAAYGEPMWIFALFHQPFYSAGVRAGFDETEEMRNTLGPIFSELGIHAVFNGHDHTYTRSYMINGTEIIDDASLYTEVNGDPYGSYYDPNQGDVFYITGNSASGSKYYESYPQPFSAKANQENVPTLTKVDVTKDSLVFTTYRTGETNEVVDILDFFAIHRTGEEDKEAPKINVGDTVNYNIEDKDTILDGVIAYDNTDGDVTDKMEISGKLDPFGKVDITFTVSDSAGNTASVTSTFIPRTLQTVIPDDQEWKYLDDGSIPFADNNDIAWTTDSYDDSSWKKGVGPFGAYEGQVTGFDEEYFRLPNTLINQYYPEGNMDAGFNISTFFFKTTFDLEDTKNIDFLTLDFRYNDALDIYINGVSLYNHGTYEIIDKAGYSGTGAPEEATPALIRISDKELIDSLNLKNEGNVIAVQLFQFDIYSKEIYFHLNSLEVGIAPEAIPFEDVSKDAWYYESVGNSYNKGLFVGTTETTFSPDATMTRASVWTVLARIEGADISVKEGEDWYEGARRWAMENGVSDGTNPN